MEFRVGIILKDFLVTKFIKESIEELKNSKLNIKLYIILEDLNNESINQLIIRKYKQIGLVRLIQIIFFQIYYKIEKTILSFFSPEVLELDKEYLLDEKSFFKIIKVKPLLTKYRMYSEYSEKDIKSILDEKLDIMLRGNVANIYRGKVLKLAKYGIISFHHGDSSWNRGGPPGFWEVVFKKPSTGFIIQILNENLDSGNILFKSEFATQRTYIKNLYNLLNESNCFISRIIIKILSEQKIPYISPNKYTSVKILKSPNFFYLFKYILITLRLYVNLFIHFILKRKQRWEIGFIRNKWNQIDFSKIESIKNQPGRYFADPFVIESKNKHYIFVEDYNFKMSKGSISVIEIDQNNNQKLFSDVIKEKFHLSFPFIFEYKNDLYIVPESSADKSIRLYKCINFPNKWIYCYNLISNINCADTIIIKKHEYYWLLTSISDKNDFSSQLNIYYSDSPISQNWKDCSNNPVRFNIDKARNAGLIVDETEKIFRPTQTCGYNKIGDNQYGRTIIIRQVKSISAYDFQETYHSTIEPIFKSNLLGVHHMSYIKNFTVLDYNYYCNLK